MRRKQVGWSSWMSWRSKYKHNRKFIRLSKVWKRSLFWGQGRKWKISWRISSRIILARRNRRVCRLLKLRISWGRSCMRNCRIVVVCVVRDLLVGIRGCMGRLVRGYKLEQKIWLKKLGCCAIRNRPMDSEMGWLYKNSRRATINWYIYTIVNIKRWKRLRLQIIEQVQVIKHRVFKMPMWGCRLHQPKVISAPTRQQSRSKFLYYNNQRRNF